MKVHRLPPGSTIVSLVSTFCCKFQVQEKACSRISDRDIWTWPSVFQGNRQPRKSAHRNLYNTVTRRGCPHQRPRHFHSVKLSNVSLTAVCTKDVQCFIHMMSSKCYSTVFVLLLVNRMAGIAFMDLLYPKLWSPSGPTGQHRWDKSSCLCSVSRNWRLLFLLVRGRGFTKERKKYRQL